MGRDIYLVSCRNGQSEECNIMYIRFNEHLTHRCDICIESKTNEYISNSQEIKNNE